MPASLADWYRLNRTDQLTVGITVDHGERVDDPRLRPMAVVLANSSLRSSGWQLLRQPGYLVVLVLVFGFAAVFGQWWVVLLELAFLVFFLWLANLRARRLRPQWQRAVQANTDTPDH